MAGGFVQYHEPSIVQILVIISFFLFLSLAEWISAKIIRAGIIGHIAVGIIYGRPLADILDIEWQQTFITLGRSRRTHRPAQAELHTEYAGRCDGRGLSDWAFVLTALSGVWVWGCRDVYYWGCAVGYFAWYRLLSFPSGLLASKTVDLGQTRVGSVLVSAAVIDDVVGLVMSSVISDLGELSSGNHHVNLGWLIGRPIVASLGMSIVTPLVTKYVFAPLFRRYIENHFARYDHISNIVLMALVLCAFIAIAAYTGTSILFGAFLAGTFLTYIPSKHPESPFVVMSREEGEREEHKSPTFVHTFERYLVDVQKYLMEPLFFASIGFAIPFVQLWTGRRIWRGVVFTLLMVFAKFVVGMWVPLWQAVFRSKSDEPRRPPRATQDARRQRDEEVEAASGTETLNEKPANEGRVTTWLSGLLLGSAMVARGEIGLLIIEIGYNETSYVSQEGFITGVWAILLNTIIGPVSVGLLVKFYGKRIGDGEWGLQPQEAQPPAGSVA
ncbi:cation:proton antiporter [Aspergillus mulundensis]|uniref:Cation/H+ exchanger transmembrane domain-containing protein n=1 Tax=Aspergillus mulundensis TaxID=1810919 RepID=A0A3D8QRI6_9EURO|nr:Uncharacterized protein DSM5745_09847 [Aspergillus mulundensis]RDW64436.1 Uncharacterized protein DSM5745_09847 [Aspergillus mulundensis]